MRMKYWTEDGYGMHLFTAGNAEKIYRFIAEESPELLPSEEEYCDAINSGFEDCCDILWDCLGEPASWHIANRINKLEGTTVFKGYASCGDTDQEEMIGVEPCYPWTANKVDRSLTKEKANAILMKYAEILGIDDVPEYFEAEYVG